MIDFNTETAIALLDSTSEHPISIDNAWQWLGYSKKSDFLTVFRNSQFREWDDYWFDRQNKTNCDPPIFLTVECFTLIGRITKTYQASRCVSILLSVCDLPSRRREHWLH